MTDANASAGDHVEIRVPADSAYLAILRTATAGIAARMNFTIDDIEDLRIAVDEASSLLLAAAADGTQLTCRFDIDDEALQVMVSVPSDHGEPPQPGTFAWTVLTALAGEVDAASTGDTVTVTLRKSRVVARE